MGGANPNFVLIHWLLMKFLNLILQCNPPSTFYSSIEPNIRRPQTIMRLTSLEEVLAVVQWLERASSVEWLRADLLRQALMLIEDRQFGQTMSTLVSWQSRDEGAAGAPYSTEPLFNSQSRLAEAVEWVGAARDLSSLYADLWGATREFLAPNVPGVDQAFNSMLQKGNIVKGE